MTVTPAAPKPMNVASLIAGLASVFKAIPNDKMEDLKDVVDMWNQPGGEHQNPGRGEIITGPAERMSGDGAPKMIAEYSSPAPQQGLTAQYQEFQRMLDGWGKSFSDSLTGKLNPILSRHDTALKSILGVFEAAQKAQTATPAAPPADSFLGKALLKISKARSEMRKADLADEDEKEERKSHITAASDMLKSAKRLLAKASEEMEDTDDEATEKAMSDLRAITKAVAKAEDEEKEKDEAAKSAAAAAQKATADAAAATQKAEEDKKKEEEEAAKSAAAAAAVAGNTAKAAVTQEQILKALEGLTTLPTTVQGLMDAVMGKSAVPGGAPEIAKGTIETVDFATRVDQAIDDGTLTENGEMRALSLVQHLALAKAGRMDIKLVEAEIAKSPEEVRVLFQAAA